MRPIHRLVVGGVRRLKLLRVPSQVFSTSSQLPLLDSDPLESLQVASPQIDEPKPGYDFKSHFHFERREGTSDYIAQEGAYVDLHEGDLLRYFPEGLAGEANEEFGHSSRTAWMIRDCGKLLCRLLDEYSADKANTPIFSKTSVQTPVKVGQLTDRPEWVKSQIRVKRFGRDLYRATPINDVGMQITNGPGSVVDEYLKQIKDKKFPFPTKIMLSGERGSGKSMALNQLVMHARRRGDWIVVFIPNGWQHVQGGIFVEPVTDDVFGKVYDNRHMSVEVLRGIWRAHRTQLAEIPFNKPEKIERHREFLSNFEENWNREVSVTGKEKLSFVEFRARVEGGDAFPHEDAKDVDVLKSWDFNTYKVTNLEELVQFGVAFRDLSGHVLMDLVKELEVLESHKVLFVVDEYNSWSAKSAYEYEYTPVMGHEILVPRIFGYLKRKKAEGETRGIKNGLFICAESLKHPEGAKDLYKAAASSVPLTIHVPQYSQVEFLSAVSYYTEQHIVHEGISTQNLLTYRMMVNSNPRHTRLETGGFFVRIAMDSVKGDYMMAAEGGDITELTEDDAKGDEDLDLSGYLSERYK